MSPGNVRTRTLNLQSRHAAFRFHSPMGQWLSQEVRQGAKQRTKRPPCSLLLRLLKHASRLGWVCTANNVQTACDAA